MAIQNLRNQIKNIINLPSLPSITFEIIKMMDDPLVNVQTLSKAIAKDQTIASKVIKVANSPFFSYPKAISTIDFAITVLGFETVKEIVLSASYIGHFKNYQNSVYDTKSFWSHLAISTVVCREISKAIKYPLIGEPFVAGLIHDIGIFIMSQIFQKEFTALLAEIEKGNTDLLALENTIYGSNHATIGSWLLEKWNFPPQLVEAVQFHHNPQGAVQNKTLPAILYCTEYITNTQNWDTFDIEASLSFNPSYLSILGFSNVDDLNNIFAKNKEQIDQEIKKAIAFYT
jgi:HD-like signal output (HDOD) protein